MRTNPDWLKRFPALTARQAEFIGLHLKSKFVSAGQSMWEVGGADREKFIREPLTARIKMTTEAINVRGNIDAKFHHGLNPAIYRYGWILSIHSAPHILLDHMIFTQALVNGLLPWRIDSGAIKVEHEIPELINAGLPAARKLTSIARDRCSYPQFDAG